MTVPYHPPDRVAANGVTLVYDAFGDPAAPPLLLVMGLGAQMIAWDEEFCRQLAERDLWVIRFDNRDVGLATRFDDAGVPDPFALMRGEGPPPPYDLSDMAADAVGLLDALDVEAAHIAGASMGGMIAQTMALEHSDRVRSLTSIMSSPEPMVLLEAQPAALQLMVTPSPAGREAYIAQSVTASQILSGSDRPIDEARVRRRAAEAFDRGLSMDGTARQIAAVIASGDRTAALRQLTIPTLVIHGADDPLLVPEGGRATAEAIPDSQLLIVEGMGHNLPPALFPLLADAIAGHVYTAEKVTDETGK